jgi:hypothetical protein
VFEQVYISHRPRSWPARRLDLKTGLVVVCLSLASGCTTPQSNQIDRQLLQTAWAADGVNFEFVIGEDTILYEFDMKEHPYALDGNILVVDFQDPTLGVQRKEILRLTKEELELRDVRLGDPTTVFRRVQ